jgi:hypothetical protein
VFRVARRAFDDAGVTVPGGFVRAASPTSANVTVTFGARAGAIIAAIPAADRDAAIVAAVAAARTFAGIGRRSNAGTGRVDMHAVMAARGGTDDDANAARRRLARTRTRRARAAAIVAPATDA